MQPGPMPMPQMHHSDVLHPQHRHVSRQDRMEYPCSHWWLCQAKQDPECPCSYIWLHTWGDEYSCWKLTERSIAGADLSKLLLFFFPFPTIKWWAIPWRMHFPTGFHVLVSIYSACWLLTLCMNLNWVSGRHFSFIWYAFWMPLRWEMS